MVQRRQQRRHLKALASQAYPGQRVGDKALPVIMATTVPHAALECAAEARCAAAGEAGVPAHHGAET